MNDFADNEKELILYLQKGESAALEYIYDHYSAALYGIIVKILKGNKIISEDVLQETFIKIWTNRIKYDSSKATLFTWMLNIARNTAIDTLRSSDFNRHSVNRVSIDSVHIDEELHSPSPQYAEDIILKEILNQLPPEQIQIIELMYYQGYTQTEIATQYSIPLGTVKSRARLAIETLRKILIHDSNILSGTSPQSFAAKQTLTAIIAVLTSEIVDIPTLQSTL